MTTAPEQTEQTEAAQPVKATARKRPLASVTPAGAAGEVAALQARVAELETLLEARDAAEEQKWFELGKAADSRGLCSEYDEVVKGIGGVPRYRQVSIIIELKARTTLNEAHMRSAAGLDPYTSFAPVEAPSFEWTTPLTMIERVKIERGRCGCTSIDATMFAHNWLRGNRMVRTTTVLSAEATSCDVRGCQRRRS